MFRKPERDLIQNACPPIVGFGKEGTIYTLEAYTEVKAVYILQKKVLLLFAAHQITINFNTI